MDENERDDTASTPTNPETEDTDLDRLEAEIPFMEKPVVEIAQPDPKPVSLIPGMIEPPANDSGTPENPTAATPASDSPAAPSETAESPENALLAQKEKQRELEAFIRQWKLYPDRPTLQLLPAADLRRLIGDTICRKCPAAMWSLINWQSEKHLTCKCSLMGYELVVSTDKTMMGDTRWSCDGFLTAMEEQAAKEN